jgi:hypothetical protein
MVFFFINNLEAHSGRTNSEGCHNEKKTGGYHCHKTKYYSDNNSNNKNVIKPNASLCNEIEVVWDKYNQEVGKGQMRVDFKSSSASTVIINDLTIWTKNNYAIHKYELGYVLKPYGAVTRWFGLDSFNQDLIHNVTYTCSLEQKK